MSRHRLHSFRTGGFTVLEVLIALLIFSFGLIGLAGLLMVSVKTNHGAYLRSQAIFLAGNLADRMRANVYGVWKDSYNATYPVKGTAPDCSTAKVCTPAQLTLRDQVIWGGMMQTLLPNPSATLDCARPAGAPAVTADILLTRPPYDGLCTLRISWSEQSLAIGGNNETPTFSWVFKP